MSIISVYATLAYYLFLILAGFGIVNSSIEMMALATCGVGVTYAARDYFDARPGKLSVMSFYALFGACWFGISNYVGYWSENTIYRAMFFDYPIPEFFLPSQIIATLAVVIPLVFYDVFDKFFGARLRVTVPKVGFQISDPILLRTSIVLLIWDWSTELAGFGLPGLGSITGFLGLGSYIAIFVLTMRWQGTLAPAWPTWTRLLPVAIALTEFFYSTILASERGRVAWPLVAYFLPFVLRKKVKPAHILAGVLAFFAFTFVFKQLAQIRQSIYGTDRIDYVMNKMGPKEEPIVRIDASEADEADTTGIFRLLARLSTFNQLSQVCNFADQEGFYEGETMRYLYFVFIPRIIWPDKPLVAPGQWFARKIGRGMETESGGFSNAINMTIPGELYLNYSWVGVIVGLIIVSAIYAFFWEASSMMEEGNLLGTAFGFTLLYQAIFNGSHLGGVVNLVIWYCTFLGLTYFADTMSQRSKWNFLQRKQPALPAQKILNQHNIAHLDTKLARQDWGNR